MALNKLQNQLSRSAPRPPVERRAAPAREAAGTSSAMQQSSLLESTHGPGSTRFGNPLAYGADDLNPGGLAPGGLMLPGGGGVPLHGGAGGMMLGPGHPLFDMRFGGPRGGPGGLHDIRGVPPGARFDPIGPLGARPGHGRQPGRLGFDGEPDPDHLPPPGYGDMFM